MSQMMLKNNVQPEIENELKRVFCNCGTDYAENINHLQQAPQEALDKLLFQMILSKSFPLLKLIIELGANVNCSLDRGVTPLHYACQEGQLEVAKYLIKSGAFPLALCDKGFSLLTYAVRSLSLPMVKWALEQGCDVNHRLEGGMTVLHAVVSNPTAAENGREPEICSILEFLLNEGAVVYNIPLSPVELAEGCNLAQAAKILQDRSPKPSFFHPNFASWVLFPNQVISLIDSGADINEKNSEQGTPLSYAIGSGFFEQASILIDNGADIKVLDKQGWTLLHMLSAFHSGKEAVNLTEKLILLGLDVNAKCYLGNTALRVVPPWHSDVADILKLHGGD